MRIQKIAEGLKAEEWQLEGEGTCGLKFHNVVTVFEPLSINPLVFQRSLFGLRGLKQAIKVIEGERKRLGLKPATNKV